MRMRTHNIPSCQRNSKRYLYLPQVMKKKIRLVRSFKPFNVYGYTILIISPLFQRKVASLPFCLLSRAITISKNLFLKVRVCFLEVISFSVYYYYYFRDKLS